MADRKTDIQSVYEPGFGSMGKPEENVLIEKPVGVYGLKDKTVENYQKLLNDAGIESSPKGLLLFAEIDKEQRSAQAFSAIDHAISQSMRLANFPKVQRRKEMGGMNYQISEMSPFNLVTLTGGFTHTNSEAGAKIPLHNILLCKTDGATDAEYNRAAKMIFEEANKTLQIFGADFRIPQFSSSDDLSKI